MTKYRYNAIDETGRTVSGVIESETLEMAEKVVEARGLVPTAVVEATTRGEANVMRLRDRLTAIKAPELILFTKQFRTMLRAGVPIVNLLQILQLQTENPALQRIAEIIERDIREGTSLHVAMRRHPKAFSPLYCGMVQAGEASGALPEVLDRLIYIIDHENKIRSDIRAALQYPAIVLVLLSVAFFILLTFVIPRFVRIFVSAGLALPVPTRVCMALYQFLAHYWGGIVGVLILGGIALRYYLRTTQGKLMRDMILMRLPILGPLFVKAAMSRFASIFSILQSSGVSVVDSMRILGFTVGNTAIAREFDRIVERLEEGRGIAEPLRGAKYFTPIVINMVAIGEESGNLEEMLSEIAGHYDTEVEYAMKKLSDAVGPILTVGLAAVVGFFALAIFLPMWNLIGVVK